MCDPVTLGIVAATAAVAGTGYSIYSGEKAASAQKAAATQAQKNADATYQSQDEANNKANQKQPDISAIASANQRAAQGGQSGTMLTGAGGVATSALSLGKTTLLGG